MFHHAPALVAAEGDNDRVRQSLNGIFESQTLCSIATADQSGAPHINTCFFAYNSGYKLIVFTDPDALHSQNISNRADCAVNIFSSSQVVGDDLKGVQLIGKARMLHGAEAALAFKTYCIRFPIILKWAASWEMVLKGLKSRFYEITIHSGKLLDELTFGKEHYITFSISQ